ncbi:MAG: hypothetical protein MJZ03_00345 [archaeon]|nr:hypothetical protein [archaeon]
MILYTIGCPKCIVLEKKLAAKGIPFEICNDIETIKAKGYDLLPVLEDGDNIMPFKEAVDFINSRED